MESYDPALYGERIADIYDDLYPPAGEAMIARLEELARGGPALELAIGTGRVALPLAARGVPVHGIDASPAMVARLRAKSGGAGIPVTMGDFADAILGERYPLVYLVFNTLFCLLTQTDQLRCFQNAAAHLTEDGAFVLDLFVPELSRFTRGQNIQTNRVEADRVMMDVSMHDPVEQRVSSQQVILTEAGIRLLPVDVRYAWPSELDLMARLAGLRLRHRWGGWEREPFTAASTRHVSVYERDGR